MSRRKRSRTGLPSRCNELEERSPVSGVANSELWACGAAGEWRQSDGLRLRWVDATRHKFIPSED
jgi:hypothetical protein